MCVHVQILIGKTGKSSLKRRVAECEVGSITEAVVRRVARILSQNEFTVVQDTSLGCAVFYSWVSWVLVVYIASYFNDLYHTQADDMVEETRSVLHA